MEVSSIAEQLFFTTVRVETQDGADGQGTGTSCIFGYQSEGKQYPFLVTSKHVIEGAKEGRLTFIQAQEGKPLLGTGYALDIDEFEQLWYRHPSREVDIAVTPLVPLVEHVAKTGVDIFYRAISSDLVPSQETLSKLDALEEIVFIGYPSGIWDRKNLLPIMRKGTTATPIAVDFQGEKQFLIDASVFPGSSGSPVFLYNPGMYFEKTGATVVGTRLLFLGVVASVFFEWAVNEILSVARGDVPVALSKQMIDLGIVFKATTIVEAIRTFLKERDLAAD